MTYITDLIKPILTRVREINKLIEISPVLHVTSSTSPSPLTANELLFLTGPDPNQTTKCTLRKKHEEALKKIRNQEEIIAYFASHVGLPISENDLKKYSAQRILLSIPMYDDIDDIGMFTICEHLIAYKPSEHLDPFYLTLLTLKLHSILQNPETFATHSVLFRSIVCHILGIPPQGVSNSISVAIKSIIFFLPKSFDQFEMLSKRHMGKGFPDKAAIQLMAKTALALKQPSLHLDHGTFVSPLEYLTKLNELFMQELTTVSPVDSAPEDAPETAADTAPEDAPEDSPAAIIASTEKMLQTATSRLKKANTPEEIASAELEVANAELKLANAQLEAVKKNHQQAQETYKKCIDNLQKCIQRATYPTPNPTLFSSLLPSFLRRNRYHQDRKNQLLQLHLCTRCIDSDPPIRLQILLRNNTAVNYPDFSTLPDALQQHAQTLLKTLKDAWSEPVRLFGIIPLPQRFVEFFNIKNTLPTHTEAIYRELQANNNRLLPHIDTAISAINKYHDATKELATSTQKLQKAEQKQQQASQRLEQRRQADASLLPTQGLEPVTDSTTIPTTLFTSLSRSLRAIRSVFGTSSPSPQS